MWAAEPGPSASQTPGRVSSTHPAFGVSKGLGPLKGVLTGCLLNCGPRAAPGLWVWVCEQVCEQGLLSA